jgi:hypothetical protein
MEKYHGKSVEYWKQNAKEDYAKTPISVLRYITILEEQAEQLRQPDVVKSVCQNCHNKHTNIDYEGFCSQSCFNGTN